MQLVETPKAYEVIGQVTQRVPREAQKVLQAYANNRVKELKLVTKAYKFDFPFHDTEGSRLSLQKLLQLIKRDIFKKVPWLESENVLWGSVYRPRTTLYFNDSPAIKRYMKRIERIVSRNNLPIRFYGRNRRQWTGTEYVDGYSVEISIHSIYESKQKQMTGVILLYYLPEIMKFFQTASRIVRYDASRAINRSY